MAERWPQMTTDDLAWGLLEPEAGVLLARRAVAATARAFVEEGGVLRHGRASVDGEDVFVGEERLAADAFVFAAGPWLPKLLGSVPGLELEVPQQEVIYFATPPGDARFDAGQRPHLGRVRRRLLRPAVDRGSRLQGRAGLAGADRGPRPPGASHLRRASRGVPGLPAPPLPGAGATSRSPRVASASTS